MTAIRQLMARQPPGGALLGGRWIAGSGALPVLDPEDGRLIATVHKTTPDEVAEAVSGLARAFADGQAEWPVWERRESLYAACARVRADASRLAGIISAEGSKTIREAAGEVRRTSETLRLTAEAADRLSGETLPTANTPRGTDRFGWFTREPIGVVAAITPFNDPLNLVAHKVAPALMAGNVVAVKPAEATPLSALALADLLLQSGVPADRLSVLPGDGPSTGNALVRDDRVDLVSFTGGWHTGNLIARAAGAKKTLMELGGNCAVLVLPDADLEGAARDIVDGAFGAAGQNCVSVQRVLAHAAVFGQLLDLIVERTRALRVGSKADVETDIGPMIDEASARRVHDLVMDAERHGARVCTGASHTGAFYSPTVLTSVDVGARLHVEEAFGPVVLVNRYEDISAAINQMNSSPFGLHAGIFTRDIDAALEVVGRLRVGGVMINDTSDFRIDAMPFGGVKHSGIGREGVRFALEAMTEPKVVIVRRSAPRT